MFSPDSEAVIEKNYKELPRIFRTWMRLPLPLSPKGRKRWGEVYVSKLPDEVQAYLDRSLSELDTLIDDKMFQEAALISCQKIDTVESEVPQEYLNVVKSLLFRRRSTAQGQFAEESGVFQPLDTLDIGRARCFISAGVDGLRSNIVRGVITLETIESAQYFGFAGMSKVEYAIARRVRSNKLNELLVDQVPRDLTIASLENSLVKGLKMDFGGLKTDFTKFLNGLR